jgi:hypothetical protein
MRWTQRQRSEASFVHKQGHAQLFVSGGGGNKCNVIIKSQQRDTFLFCKIIPHTIWTGKEALCVPLSCHVVSNSFNLFCSNSGALRFICGGLALLLLVRDFQGRLYAEDRLSWPRTSVPSVGLTRQITGHHLKRCDDQVRFQVRTAKSMKIEA